MQRAAAGFAGAPVDSGMDSPILFRVPLAPFVLLAGITVASGQRCPDDAAIAAELDRLGARPALDQMGGVRVSVEGAHMHLAFVDQREGALGARTVDAPADCGQRAVIAAVLVAAWTGEWIRTNLGDENARTGERRAAPGPGLDALPAPAATPAPASAARATPSPYPAPATVTSTPRSPVVPRLAVASAAPAPTPTPPPAGPIQRAPDNPAVATTSTTRVRSPFVEHAVAIELGALGFGAHDGDAGALGVSGHGMLRLGPWAIEAVVDAIGERQRPLGPGQAGYSSVRLGLGPGLHKRWRRGFVSFAVVPEAARYTLRGSELTQARQVSAWGFVLDGRVRAGLAWGRVAPFVYLGASWSFLRERMGLDDRPALSVSLSRANLAAGLGISVQLR